MFTRSSAGEREARATLSVYGQLPIDPQRGNGCDIITKDGRHILDLYGGHAVAALGYGHPQLTRAIHAQASDLLFQSNAVPLDVRAEAAEKLVGIAPDGLTRAFFVNSGAEANENALRMACIATGRRKICAVTHGFHGRTAAAGAVTWNSGTWYGFPEKPFDVEFIVRDDCESVRELIDADTAAVIFEPVQGVAGAYDLSARFVETVCEAARRHGALLIADEVQSGMGRSGHYFAVEAYGVEPDILTAAKSLGGGIPAGALLCGESLASGFGPGDLGTTFGGGPLAAAAIVSVIGALRNEKLLANVRAREAQIREQCVVGPITRVQGMGLLLGLVCDRPAVDVQRELLDRNILTGTSSDPAVLRVLAPLILEQQHVERFAAALRDLPPMSD